MFLEQYRLLIYVFNKVMRNTISIKFLMKRYKKRNRRRLYANLITSTLVCRSNEPQIHSLLNNTCHVAVSQIVMHSGLDRRGTMWYVHPSH